MHHPPSRAAWLSVAAATLIAAAASSAEDASVSAPATLVTAQQFQAALAAAPPGQAEYNHIVQPVVLPGQKISVDINRRLQAEEAPVLHERVTEIYQVISGGGMLRTGGKMIAPQAMKITARNASIGPSFRGSAIEGGETRHVGAGDVVVIPPKTPHMFTALDGPTVYSVIRIDQPH